MRIPPLSILALIAFHPLVAHAQITLWTGPEEGGSFTDPANWSTGEIPSGCTSDQPRPSVGIVSPLKGDVVLEGRPICLDRLYIGGAISRGSSRLFLRTVAGGESASINAAGGVIIDVDGWLGGERAFLSAGPRGDGEIINRGVLDCRDQVEIYAGPIINHGTMIGGWYSTASIQNFGVFRVGDPLEIEGRQGALQQCDSFVNELGGIVLLNGGYISTIGGGPGPVVNKGVIRAVIASDISPGLVNERTGQIIVEHGGSLHAGRRSHSGLDSSGLIALRGTLELNGRSRITGRTVIERTIGGSGHQIIVRSDPDEPLVIGGELTVNIGGFDYACPEYEWVDGTEELILSTSLTGRFDRVDVSPIPYGLVGVIEYTDTAVVLNLTRPCYADICGSEGSDFADGSVDQHDANRFMRLWIDDQTREWGCGTSLITDTTTTGANPGQPGYGEPDGEVDGADLSYFTERWLAGCG